MHWKAKIFLPLYQNAAIPTPYGPRQICLSSEIPEPGLKIWEGFTLASLPAALTPFRARAGAGFVPRVQDPGFFLRSSGDGSAAAGVGAAGAGSAISWLSVPAAECGMALADAASQSSLRAERCQRGGMRARELGCWGGGGGKAAPSTKHGSDNTVHHLAPLQSLRQRQLSVPRAPEVLCLA